MMLLLGTVAALCAVLERLGRLRFRASPFFRPYFASDVSYLLTGFVAGGSAAMAYVATASGWLEGRLGLPSVASTDLPLAVSVVAGLVALDLGNYGAHVLLHRVDALWELHKVHHSSRSLDWLATFRSHILEQAVRRLVAPLLLIATGFPLDAVVLAHGLFLTWAMLNHANLRLDLRFLEPILITPRLHRLHHVPGTTERNLGTVFTFWDRLRGTLVTVEASPACTFGVPGEVTTYPQGWVAQLVEPPRRIIGTRGRRVRQPAS